jgi:hypothetical protein
VWWRSRFGAAGFVLVFRFLLAAVLLLFSFWIGRLVVLFVVGLECLLRGHAPVWSLFVFVAAWLCVVFGVCRAAPAWRF